VLELGRAELEGALEEVREHGAMPLAECVESRELHEACEELGFRLFQGYYYREPETLEARELGVTYGTVIRLMNHIRDPDVPDAEIADEFRTDPALSYKLLRIVKTASIGARGVTSIGHAVRLLGRKPLYRWLSLLFLSSLSSGQGVKRELTETAIVRARLMELLAEATGEGRESESYFLVGLFSLIEPLLETPLEAVLDRVDLEPRLRRSLLEGAGPIGAALELVRAHEEGDWGRTGELASELGFGGDLTELYVSALDWARQRLEEVAEEPGDAD
ncbi:MAG: EAL and HDOD domain-containing protein, partial [Gemmatimonadota bacterium]